jgi:CHAT domain-containing protein
MPDGLQRFTVKVDRETLTTEIRAFRSRLEKRTTHEYYQHARQLYDWLFLPIEPELRAREIETLVIVPDGPMRTIPLAALHDGEKFLGARYALATTPGLTLTDPRPIERKDVELLANGLSVAVQGFPGLPNVEDEIASIEQLYGGTVLKNQSFVVANMERELADRPFSIVHIASHGQFDSEIANTFLLTYDDKLSMNALEQFIASTKFREDPVELLTLSACQTAAGDDRAALGLAGIAVKAGARSAVATLWTVNDPASAALVTEFYEQLKDPQLSKAQALQRAQLKISSDLRYWHPSYWSPFLLIGNWL